jgi:hypothetical protein
MDLETNEVVYAPVQGEGQFNAGASWGEMNDFVYGANTSAAPQSRADTLFVLDGVTGTSFRLDLPSGAASFQNLQPAPQLNLLIGLATSRQPGDAGFVVFDLDRAEARTLNLPEGFASMTQLGVFLATRKLVARGIKTGAASSQLLVYDLVTNDLQIVPNPDGVVWVGAPPVQQPQPPLPDRQPATPAAPPVANVKANTVAAVTYGEDRKQTGVMVVRIP